MIGTLMRPLASAATVAAAMYFFDPDSGRRRRALLRDRVSSTARDFSESCGVAARDLSHRLRGLSSRGRHLFARDRVTDEVLAERVRSGLGRSVSHPGAINVSVTGGTVELTGDVLEHEHASLLHAVRAVRRVHEVKDRLSVHRSAQGVPALQGGRAVQRRRIGLMRESWSPATRAIASTSGGALLLHGMRRHGPLGMIELVTGSALLIRSAANKPLARLFGGARGAAIDVHKTIFVNAPVERVFETLSRYESFPAFMRNVREVRTLGEGRSHWVVAGPAGAPVEWEAETTEYRQNEALAWRTIESSPVQHAGVIRFEQAGAGTRLDIRMSYRPPAGALGHVVAKLFGADPKTELDEDLLRLKTFLETGTPPRDAAARAAQPGREVH